MLGARRGRVRALQQLLCPYELALRRRAPGSPLRQSPAPTVACGPCEAPPLPSSSAAPSASAPWAQSIAIAIPPCLLTVVCGTLDCATSLSSSTPDLQKRTWGMHCARALVSGLCGRGECTSPAAARAPRRSRFAPLGALGRKQGTLHYSLYYLLASCTVDVDTRKPAAPTPRGNGLCRCAHCAIHVAAGAWPPTYPLWPLVGTHQTH